MKIILCRQNVIVVLHVIITVGFINYMNHTSSWPVGENGLLVLQQGKNEFTHFEMPWEFVGKSTNNTKVRVIHRLYTTLHKAILGFADIGST